MAAHDVRVLKVGGSLLSCHDLPARLTRWLDTQPFRPTLVIVGGGQLADAVRELDRQFSLSVEAAHWQAIHAMRLNAFVLSQLWRGSIWIEPLGSRLLADISSWPAIGIVDPVPFVSNLTPTAAAPQLPCGWHVTSDSIAAHLAAVVGAVECVLLKSTSPNEQLTALSFQQAANLGLVDAYFPVAAMNLNQVRLVNLRATSWPELRLTPAQPEYGGRN